MMGMIRHVQRMHVVVIMKMLLLVRGSEVLRCLCQDVTTAIVELVVLPRVRVRRKGREQALHILPVSITTEV
jgi:hypothetical protein